MGVDGPRLRATHSSPRCARTNMICRATGALCFASACLGLRWQRPVYGPGAQDGVARCGPFQKPL